MAQYTVEGIAVNLGSSTAQIVQNLGSGTLYIGGTDVSAAIGFRVSPGESLAIGDDGGNCYGISDGTSDVRTKTAGIGVFSSAVV